MTLYEFNSLSIEDRYSTVWELGTFLDNYVTKGVKINCYAVNMFFVEVHYNSEYNTITEITSFKTGESLDKYSNINLPI
jgi:hypothetical protein